MSVLDFSRLTAQSSPSVIHNGTFSVTEEEREGDRPNSRAIVAGVLFSRRFIIYYNVIIIAVIFAFTTWHWTGKFMRQYRDGLTNSLNDDKPVARNATNAAHTECHSCNEPPTECSPLLLRDAEKRASPRRAISRLESTIAHWLMYQPRPIPLVNKALPDNLTSVVVAIFIAFNAFYLFYRIPFVNWAAYCFADRAGLLFVANLPLLYLFSAKNCPLQPMTGFSYENLNIFHRRLGEIICFQAFLHVTAFIYVWYDSLRPLGFTFYDLVFSDVIWQGFIAFTCYEVLYFTSLASFRAACYEVFLALHIFLQTGGLIFLYLHHEFTQPYVGAALAIFVVDRVIYRLLLARRTMQADLTILPDGHTLMLSTNWALPSSRPSKFRRLIGQHIQSGWSPADHIFVSIPSMPVLSAIQAHPFTIASTAPGPAQTHAWLDLIIRARDGFSAELLRFARSHHRIDVAVDGPYGSHHALDMMRAADTAVFVAGGSGIAVTLPIAWDIIMHNPRRQKVVLIWVVHDVKHLDWVGQDKLDELREKGCKVVVPAPTVKAGRPDMVALMAEAVGGAVDRVGVVVSGPDGMNREVNNICAGMRGAGVGVKIAVEKFGW